uniref:Uncharacterized protein n=1 Tax=Eutreptiella gymnastica TaxID=73025 RepID=A0A7S1J5S6_9EUGL|mmetsp:Transcript_69585/g.122787  ORF Transcript_69585/g.122787 Transcript_69585/m.122787 type:complete len:100 (+) Transcript_69585:2140-2439(+)
MQLYVEDSVHGTTFCFASLQMVLLFTTSRPINHKQHEGVSHKMGHYENPCDQRKVFLSGRMARQKTGTHSNHDTLVDRMWPKKGAQKDKMHWPDYQAGA